MIFRAHCKPRTVAADWANDLYLPHFALRLPSTRHLLPQARCATRQHAQEPTLTGSGLTRQNDRLACSSECVLVRLEVVPKPVQIEHSASGGFGTRTPHQKFLCLRQLDCCPITTGLGRLEFGTGLGVEGFQPALDCPDGTVKWHEMEDLLRVLIQGLFQALDMLRIVLEHFAQLLRDRRRWWRRHDIPLAWPMVSG